MLCVLLFNLWGYRLLIDFVQAKKEAALLVQLDKEAYADEDLITIKTGIALPYYVNSATYERVDGTIEMEGTEYKYVKRRIYNDSLELLCVPNKTKQELETAKDAFFKLTNEGTANTQKGETAKSFKNLLPDYYQELGWQLMAFELLKNKALPYLPTPFLPTRASLQQDRPPEWV